MKFFQERPYSDPKAAAIRLVEIANTIEAPQEGRIFIELLNEVMLYKFKATPAEYKAGLDFAIKCGWLEIHESGTYVKFAQAGAELFV